MMNLCMIFYFFRDALACVITAGTCKSLVLFKFGLTDGQLCV